MDAPLTEFGKEVWFKDKQTNLCYDALGVPAATARGLFEYVYGADTLTLYPRIPPSIEEYRQEEPIRWGGKRIRVSVLNGGPRVKSVTVNGRVGERESGRVVLRYDELPMDVRVEIVMDGAGTLEASNFRRPASGTHHQASSIQHPVSSTQFPEILRAPHEELAAAKAGSDYERAYLAEALRAFEAYRERAARDAAGEYVHLTPEKRAAILKMYEDAALGMHRGFTAKKTGPTGPR
jgi:hypothetical protein